MTNFKTFISCAAVSLTAFGAVACGDDDDANGGMGGMTSTGGSDSSSGGSDSGAGGDDGGEECQTILEIAVATPELSSLVAAVQAAGLEDALGGDDLTVFAPTNDAFADLLAALDIELTDLTADQLTPILTYHVAGSVIDSAAALSVAAGDGNFDTLGGNVKIEGDAMGLVLDADEASAEIQLDLVDIEACNGVVHVIDGVILPSITDIVVTQDGFTSLAGVVVAADGADGTTPKVAEALDGSAGADKAFTLFAPNNTGLDAALADLGSGAPSGQDLTNILLFHVHGDAAIDAATAIGGGADQAVPTLLSGESLTVQGVADPAGVSIDESYMDGGADVVIADIYAANGIIHVVDDLLVPAP